MSDLVLTPGQELGAAKFMQFYCDPNQTVMLLKGYSGTGKSTLIRYLIAQLPEMAEMCRFISPEWIEPEVLLTATTNQAASALYISTGQQIQCTTIHSALSLRLHTPDYRYPDVKELKPMEDPVENKLIFVDEISFGDEELVRLILQQTRKCKIVFVGDPAQLKPVGSDIMPAFELNACEIELTDLVRFDGGPMTEIVSNMRTAVLDQRWAKFPLVPGVIERLSQADFDAKAFQLFSDPDQGQVKILAYTNNRVTQYNNKLAKQVHGTSEPRVGMFMVSNAMVFNNASRVNNNEEVQIASVEETSEYAIDGWEITFIGKGGYYFMPRVRGHKKRAHETAVIQDNYQAMKIITDTWIDLRPTFACTVNKAQGSTFDYGLIDLNDICGKCRTLDQLARLLYVAISRFRKGVYFTGDLRRS